MSKFRYLIPLLLLIFCSARTNIADYSIHVSLNDTLKIISGYETIEYKNNSSDTLHNIVLHLYANMFKKDSEYILNKGKTIKPEDEGYIIIDSIVDSRGNMLVQSLEYTLSTVKLNELIMPDSNDMYTVYFTHKIPKPFLREGYSEGKYDISQWYPKIAVYKDGKWSDFQAHRYSEYYGEYGDYTIHINMPAKYMMFGTGIIVGPEEELTLLDSIRNTGYYSGDSIEGMKTIIVKAENVHDFAFVLRNEFCIAYNDSVYPAIEIIADEKSFDKFSEQEQNISDIIAYYSDKYYQYPYESFTVAQGMLKAGGGMEYPQFTIVSDPGVPDIGILKNYLLEEVISHEIAHQWFYLILGSDEAEEPFMDEAFAVYSENEYMEDKYGKHNNFLLLLNRPLISLFDMNYISYMALQTSGNSEPLNIPSYEYESFTSYGINVYSKGYLAVRTIEAMMGESEFELMLKEYFKERAFTHTSITDFINYVNAYTDNMYFTELRNLLTENVYTDYYIKGIKNFNNNYTIEIGNYSPFEFPVDILITFDDKSDTLITKNINAGSVDVKGKHIDNIIIDPEQKFLDIDYHNNNLKSGIAFHFINLRPDYFKTNVYIFPWIDHSLMDKFSWGVGLQLCDFPTLPLEGMRIYGKWSMMVFLGLNRGRNLMYRHRFASYQGYKQKTKYENMMSYSADIFHMYNSIGSFSLDDSRNASNYDMKIYAEYILHNGDSVYYRTLGQRKISVLGFDYRYDKKDKWFYFYVNPSAVFSDEIIYSSSEFQKINLKTGFNVNSGLWNAGISINSGFTFGDINPYSGYYLYSSEMKLFDELSAGNSYPFYLDYINGQGYITEIYADSLFSNMNKLRVNGGMRNLFVYMDIIASTELTAKKVIYQTGLCLKLGKPLTIEIPLYNDELGFLAGKAFRVSLSSELLK